MSGRRIVNAAGKRTRFRLKSNGPNSVVPVRSMFDSVAAQMLLLKCVGDEIWSESTCREAGVPNAWIDELCENYESGFDSDVNTIYGEDGKLTNQYRGVSDLLLARKLAEFIGLDWQNASSLAFDRRGEVTAIQDLLDEF